MKLTKFYSIQLTAIMLLLLLLSRNAAAEEAARLAREERIGLINEQFYSLMDYFSENELIPEGCEYPDFYAGTKIDEDYTALTVFVTNDSDEIREIVTKGTGNPELLIEKVTYSYNELESVQSQLFEHYLYLKENPDENACGFLPNVSSMGLEISANCVYVTIIDYTEADFDAISEFFAQPGFPGFDAVEYVGTESESPNTPQ